MLLLRRHRRDSTIAPQGCSIGTGTRSQGVGVVNPTVTDATQRR
jgi:hypothetical protein